MTPIVGDLIQSTVGKVVDRLAGKYLPASMGEKDRADFKLEAQRLVIEELKTETDLEKIHVEDRDSARKREIEVKDKTPTVLAGVSFVGFFGILGLMMFVEIPANAKDPMLIMLGALGAIVTGITQYYFGSSSGSAKKNNLLARMMGGR